MITAEKLYEKLKDIQVGNPVCRFTQEHCELLLPTISRIELCRTANFLQCRRLHWRFVWPFQKRKRV